MPIILPEILPEFTGIPIFDLNNITNELYKYNSIDGGVIVPRGTSILVWILERLRFVLDMFLIQ